MIRRAPSFEERRICQGIERLDGIVPKVFRESLN